MHGEHKVVRKQKVDVFFGLFQSGYKPDARCRHSLFGTYGILPPLIPCFCLDESYNVQQEDIDSFLKTGLFKHGEWLVEGGRCFGGDHRESVPARYNIVERQQQPPDFPEYGDKLDITDGCAVQFAGKVNYHQTAAWSTRLGILRNHLQLVSMHGKNICDGQA